MCRSYLCIYYHYRNITAVNGSGITNIFTVGANIKATHSPTYCGLNFDEIDCVHIKFMKLMA